MQSIAENRLPPSIADLRPLLASGDIDRVAALALSLLFELVDLSERLAKLEGADPAAANERIARLVERALART